MPKNLERENDMNLADYDISQADHRLRCHYQICRNGFDYSMPCIILNKTKSGKLKIVVFGDRYWKNKEHIKRIRYVYPYRVFLSSPSVQPKPL